MENKLEYLSKRYAELGILISDPDLPKDPKRYKSLLQEHSFLTGVMEEYNRYKKISAEIHDAEAMLREESDHEIRELARSELKNLEQKRLEAENRLKDLLIPKDPLEQKNIIMEIRAGTGGEEAALFAADLFRMYSLYGDGKRWKTEIISSTPTEIGGYKEIIFSVSGTDVFGFLRYESGVHRVQRVPETESGGRIHTSAVTVAVLPEAEDTDIEINPEELRIDTYRAGGAGGQHVNKTESAVRITHLPTGLVVICQDEKSQHKNKAKALLVLRSRLFELEENRKRQERAENRKIQVGSGDRSERIRTYNFPQNRVSDHRINVTLYKLDAFINGALDEIIEPLRLNAREEAVREQTANV